jgi:hypothetical protein
MMNQTTLAFDHKRLTMCVVADLRQFDILTESLDAWWLELKALRGDRVGYQDLKRRSSDNGGSLPFVNHRSPV